MGVYLLTTKGSGAGGTSSAVSKKALVPSFVTATQPPGEGEAAPDPTSREDVELLSHPEGGRPPLSDEDASALISSSEGHESLLASRSLEGRWPRDESDSEMAGLLSSTGGEGRMESSSGGGRGGGAVTVGPFGALSKSASPLDEVDDSM